MFNKMIVESKFLEAIFGSDLKTIKCYLENNKNNPNAVNIKDKHGFTPLMYACALGWTKVVKLLIKAGANVNEANNNKKTALMIASGVGERECVKLLIDANADVNAKDVDGNSSIMYAARQCNFDVAKLLLTVKNIELVPGPFLEITADRFVQLKRFGEIWYILDLSKLQNEEI